MPNLSAIYNDSLFGVILLLVLIALIALIDYLRNYYREYKRALALKSLSKNYEYIDANLDAKALLDMSHDSVKTLMFLAHTYAKVGNNEQAIKIYLAIIESLNSASEKLPILRELGIIYYHTGFLQRSRDIFLQILKSYPKDAKALEYLIKIYEGTAEYKDALITLSCLEELLYQNSHLDPKTSGLSGGAINDKKHGFKDRALAKVVQDTTPLGALIAGKEEANSAYTDAKIEGKSIDDKAIRAISKQKNYLKTLAIIDDTSINMALKTQRLCLLLDATPSLARLIIGYIMHYDSAAFYHALLRLDDLARALPLLFSHVKTYPNMLLDIITKLEAAPPLNIALASDFNKRVSFLKDVARAKGLLNDGRGCSIFELEALRCLSLSSLDTATLGFEYTCKECFANTPFDEYRCSACGALGEMDVMIKIKKINNEADRNFL